MQYLILKRFHIQYLQILESYNLSDLHEGLLNVYSNSNNNNNSNNGTDSGSESGARDEPAGPVGGGNTSKRKP